MKTQLSISLFALLTATLLLHSLAAPTTNKDIEFIRSNCQKVSTYPDLCFSLLSRYAHQINQNTVKLTRVAISISLRETKGMANYVSTITRQADFGADEQGVAPAVNQCYSSFTDAVDSIHDSIMQMRSLHLANSKESYRFMLSNVQTYMSTALTDEEDCLDVIVDVTDEKVIRDIREKTQTLEKVTSVALALVSNYVKQLTPP